MRRNALCLMLAIIMLLSCSSIALAADANDNNRTKPFDDLVEAISDFSIGDTVRSIVEATEFKDVRYMVSPKGEPVRLSTIPLCDHLKEYVKDSYTAEYQWYTYDSAAKRIVPIENAKGTELVTKPIDEPGLNFYFYQVKIFRNYKGTLSHTCIGPFFSPLYVVGYTGLPTVYIDTPNGKYITSKKEYIEDSTIQVVGGPNCDYNLDPTSIRIKGRGNSSWNSSSKGGYTIKFNKKQDLFGIGKDKTWALVGNFADKSLLRNWFASELDKKVYNKNDEEFNVTHLPVDLVINGEYRGNFTIATTIRLGDKRVNVPDISDEIEKDANEDGEVNYYDAGFIVEVNNRMDETYNFVTDHGIAMSLSDPDLDDDAPENEAIYQHIVNVVQTAEDVLYSDGFADPENGYAKYIDVDSFIDYYLLKELSKDTDGDFSLSTYLYYQPKDGKIHVASSWDFDIAFGNISNVNSNDDCDKPEGFQCNKGWYSRLFEDHAFAKKVAIRWNETRPELMNVLCGELPAQEKAIKLSARLNFLKWPELGLYTWPGATGFYTRWTHHSEADYLFDWTMQRIQWLDQAYNLWL